ncbi:hypothetical protein [Carnobacterium sp. FSL W8-0810]|uniref:hypothetical protein n=1 Tax=Carnobacterium sp. FSL W8-0810 TaxID=2954705 RepID=UPI0030F8761F
MMTHFFDSYWWMFSGVFVIASILITLNLVKVIGFRKESSLMLRVIDLILSLGLLLLMVSANFFSGVLYDQFNLATDNMLLALSFYSGVVFLIQIYFTFKRNNK